MVDVEKTNDYASKGVAGTALGISIGAGVLSLLNGGWNAIGAAAPAASAHAVCSENTGVNRYELDQAEKLANKDMEIAYWRGQDETNRKISEAYAKLEGRINDVAVEVRTNKDEQSGINLQQAVYNGTNTAAMGCLQNQVNTLLGMTKMVIPNSSVCPGWGDATVTVSTGTAAA